MASECSVFSLRELWPPSKDWGEEEICTKGAVDDQKHALNAMLSVGLCKLKITLGDM